MSDKLDKCLEAYFEQSEQLATRLILKTSERRVAGLLLQMLPGHDDARDVDAFEDAAACAATVSAEELTGLAAEDLLPKLFAGREIRLFKSHGVTHDCRCTPERLAGVVRMLGADEVRSLLAEQGQVELTCEFCNRTFRYDEQATQAILRDGAQSSVLH
jgi:molecular chaperone Hsp33